MNVLEKPLKKKKTGTVLDNNEDLEFTRDSKQFPLTEEILMKRYI